MSVIGRNTEVRHCTKHDETGKAETFALINWQQTILRIPFASAAKHRQETEDRTSAVWRSMGTREGNTGKMSWN